MRQLKISRSITNRSGESLERYLGEISRIPMVNLDEEEQLAYDIKQGGKKGERAKDRLVAANLRFVVSVAKQYQHKGLGLTDLIDEGNIGLVKAAEKFDETRLQVYQLCRLVDSSEYPPGYRRAEPYGSSAAQPGRSAVEDQHGDREV